MNKKINLFWFVLRENWNSKKIEEFNIFSHSAFYNNVVTALKKADTKEFFSDELQRFLRYYFWAKSEWEVVVTSWPPSISYDELNRAYKEAISLEKKYEHPPYRVTITPNVGKKIDIYDQVMLNYKVFLDYVWSFKKQ